MRNYEDRGDRRGGHHDGGLHRDRYNDGQGRGRDRNRGGGKDYGGNLERGQRHGHMGGGHQDRWFPANDESRKAVLDLRTQMDKAAERNMEEAKKGKNDI